jgi:predicted alpha-1,2-mannosidase
MINRRQLLGICLLGIVSTIQIDAQETKADMVDMIMGTYGASHCVVGPQLPHGSVNPSPQTPDGKHGGYKADQPIRGFGQLHVSGTGWGRYGQIFVSPQTGFDASETGHDSSKSNETATPYYYSVNLDRYGIKAEVTPTHNCTVYRFTFPGQKDANILLDIKHNLTQHIVPEVGGRFIKGKVDYNKTKNTLSGRGEYAGGFGSATPYKVYFTINMDINPKDVKIVDKGEKELYARISLPAHTEVVNMTVGISLKSTENSKRFLNEEVGTQSFDEIKSKAKSIWNNTLSLIEVKGGTKNEQRLFYTALYHSFVMPRERTGDNPNWESDIPLLDDHYCVWDTWRTKYPLMILLQESFVTKTIHSFIDRFTHNGVCNPTFTSSLDWESKQGGDDVDNIIADAIVKGVKGLDYDKAYELIRWNAFNARSREYLRLGWQPENNQPMSCSYNMEFAYNDFCAAQVAFRMNDNKTGQFLMTRSSAWEKLFNPALESFGYKGFVGPKTEQGKWITLDPAKKYGSWVDYFYEGNSWVYTLFAPHQFERLIELCGGKETMVNRLSYGFDNKLIDLSNEPGFLSPFIFTHCNRPDLTAEYVSKIRKNSFSLNRGYPDNEDSGAMGSWYVFTSIGLFPNAGQNFYYLLPPAFTEIAIEMENGKRIEINTIKNKPEDQYIEWVSVNGKKFDRGWVYHHEIAEGASLVYKLTDKKSLL